MSLSIRRMKNNKRAPNTSFKLFSLILACSLCLIACVPATASLTATQQVEAGRTGTPTATPSLEAAEEDTFPSTDIDTRMNNLVERVPLAGIALAIHFKDEFYEKGYGGADFESGEPITEETVFKIASLTKSFTAAAILRLAEEGKLSLDDPIARFIPGTPPLAEDILVRHLLNHTSGLPEWSVDTAQETLPDTFTTAEAVQYYFSTVQDLEFEPGESWSYNNVGYFLLGAIIENITGMRYDEYFKKIFFEPLALNSTYDCTSQAEGLPVGYHSVDRQLNIARSSNLHLAAAAGALCSNAGDLLRWLDALSHGKVVRPETWQQMVTPARVSGGEPLDYGFGFVITESDQGTLIMHEGATAGFNSFLVYYPEHELSIVLLTNTDGFDPTLRSIASMLAEIVLQTRES